MKKVWRGLITVIAVISVWAGVAPAVGVSAAASVDIDASAAVAVEAETGKVLYNKNAEAKLPIASMTKMLSLYLVLEAIHNKKLTWDQKITPDEAIHTISQDTALSNVPLRLDDSYSVEELYQASFIYSANAAMMLLGNAVAGTQTKFVDLMKAKLTAWGIKDATIVNATGLPNSELKADVYPGSAATDENAMTAKDVAVVAQHLLKDYPEVLKTTTITTKTFREGTSDATKMDNYDWMLPGLVAAKSDLPVDGLKTGTTDKAGDCFTGTAKKDGMRIITVVLHANGTAATKRFDQTATLMRYALSNWTTLKVATKGQAVAGHTKLAVDKGKQTSVKLAAAQDLTLVVPTGTTSKTITTTYQAAKGIKAKVEAPIKADTTVGTATFAAKGDDLGYLNGTTGEPVAVKTTKTVDKANFFVLIGRGIAEFFGNLF
ncbi:serine hydrolase [Lacticaseibacillus daqingensis]|uniref:serine hydrolase n=1 Tax=Lacticaseibacillus daqingensis TaxID=2486014 RepID=UPI000F770CB8|nr:serine hydrolase [Lacticaseibacillus daqingensis]